MQCFRVIHHDKTIKLERLGKMRRASRNEHSDFLKQLINNNCLNDCPPQNLMQCFEVIYYYNTTSKSEEPAKICQASRSDHGVFFN